MIINEKCVNKFVKYFKQNGCKYTTLLDRAEIIYEYGGYKKYLSDLYRINLVNKNGIRITIFIKINNEENIYKVLNSKNYMHFRKSYVINSPKQIKKIIDDYRSNPTDEGLTIIDDHLDIKPRELLHYFEKRNPEVRFFYLEVLLYPNLEEWILIPGSFIAIDNEESIIKNVLPVITNIEY